MQKSLWLHRNFMLLWSGQFVSWIGTEISGIALPLIVLFLTGSPAQAGAIAAMRGFLYIFLALPAGALIDRWDRRTVMVLANLGSAVAMASVAVSLWLKVLTIPQLYITGAIEGACFVFANISRMTSLPLIVEKEQLSDATAKISLADFSALTIGPAFGGFLYQVVGGVFSFFADSLSYFINALSIFFITVPLKVEKGALPESSLVAEIREGIVWYLRQPVIRFLTLVISAIVFVAIGSSLLEIVMAKSFGASSFVIGVTLGVGSVGGIAGSLVAPWLRKKFKFHTLIVTSLCLVAVAFGLYFFATNVVLLIVFTGILCMAFPIYDVTAYSYTAIHTPDAIRGRINSISRMIVMASYSLGYFFMGISIQYVGITKTILVFFVFLSIIAILAMTNKSIRVE